MREHTTGVLIVGAGQAACSAAAALRQMGYDRPIVLLGEEPHAPYQRPPLSKALMTGEVQADRLALRSPAFFEQQSIVLALNERVEVIDRARREVRTALGRVWPYEHLILATGAAAQRPPLPGADHARVLRNLDDALSLRDGWRPGQHLCIVGGGFIGLELAASARRHGLEVTVIESAERLLARVASPQLSAWAQDIHGRHGVAIHLGRQVQAIHADAPGVCRVRLQDGASVQADLVLLATGARSRDELARAAGLRCDRGVCVDAHGRTEDPGVWAIGDCAAGPELPGRPARLESIPSANEQARRVAALIAGQALPALEVPWFWSEQYQLKLQLAGIRDHSCRPVLRGDPATDRFSIFHCREDGGLQAVESVNDSSGFMAGRAWLAKPRRLDLGRLVHPGIALSDVPFST